MQITNSLSAALLVTSLLYNVNEVIRIKIITVGGQVVTRGLEDMAADLLSFGNEVAAEKAAARTHALAVTRDYISQPRLSEHKTVCPSISIAPTNRVVWLVYITVS